MEHDVGPAEAADAAAAFEALRREVALLNVAIAGLAAQRTPAPAQDYSETLGEIAKGVSVTVGRLGKLATSPALAMSPAEMIRQTIAACDEVRRENEKALHQARDGFLRIAGELRGCVESARLGRLQNRRLLQMTLAGMMAGGLLGGWLPGLVARAAPEQWAWPEKMAARMLRQDGWSAGERLQMRADSKRWRALHAVRSCDHINRNGTARPSRVRRRP